MIFCGQFTSSHRLPVTSNTGLNEIILHKGEYDDIYIEKIPDNSSQIRKPTSEIPSQWTRDTVMHAKFNGNLYSGNFNYTTDEVKSIVIKRRLKDEIYDEWLPLFEIEINGVSDNFNFNVFDRYVRAGKEYEYILVPVLQQGIEGDMIKAEYEDPQNTKVKFEGIYVLNFRKLFSSVLDVQISTDKNKPTAVINTLGAKYPYVVTTSENNYYSGNISAVFLDTEMVNGIKDFKTSDNWEYRKELNEFLQNGEPKIIKYQDGRMWMVSIYDNVSENESGHSEKITTSFSFVEIGDAEDLYNLYDNGFITYNPYNKTLKNTNNQIETNPASARYDGYIALSSGEDAENINVQLYNTTDQTLRTTTTDDDGNFSFVDLEDGNYVVSSRYDSMKCSADITVLNQQVSGEFNLILK